MANELRFIFKTADMKRLADEGSEFIVVRSFLESVVLKDGKKAGALRVYADAVKKGATEADASIEGCPDPPCGTGGDDGE